jgi:plastocyanin
MDMNNDTSQSSSSSESSTSSQPTSTDKVNITNYTFSPANITVKVGTTVTWTNNDDVDHTVTSDTAPNSGPDSGLINPGDTYTYTFNQAGTFNYHCAQHLYMKGTITVTE